MPSTDGLDGLPDVHERMARHQHVGAGHLGRDPALLGAGHEMVDQHAEPAAGLRRELGDDLGQVVDPFEVFDDHALHPEVVAPDLLHERGVVDALDVDPALLGHLGLQALDRDRNPRRCASGPGALRSGRTSVTGLPSRRKAAGSMGNSRRRPNRSSQGDGLLVADHHRPAEPVVGPLDHEVELGSDLRDRPLLGAPPVSGEHVLLVHAEKR